MTNINKYMWINVANQKKKIKSLNMFFMTYLDHLKYKTCLSYFFLIPCVHL